MCSEAADDSGAFHTDVSAVCCYCRRKHDHHAVLYHRCIHHSARIRPATARHSLVVQVRIDLIQVSIAVIQVRIAVVQVRIAPYR